MAAIDFRGMTPEQLLDLLPTTEDDKWEWKDLNPDDGRFDGNLSKQVSAFANSQGGYIVLGVTNRKELVLVDVNRKGKPWASQLSDKVHQSVEPWIQDYKIHQLDSTTDSGKAVFIVEIGDSVAAPHWSKHNENFFYRVNHKSKPAPPMHLNLLRDRITRSKLAIKEVSHVYQAADQNENVIEARIDVIVENISTQSATDWGVLVSYPTQDFVWRHRRPKKYLCEGVCVRGEQPTLLPLETATVAVFVKGSKPVAGFHGHQGLLNLWESFRILLRPVTQNNIGDEVFYGWANRWEWVSERKRFQQWMVEKDMIAVNDVID